MVMKSSLPAWFCQSIPDCSRMDSLTKILKDNKVRTVCTHARCPNMGTCWAQGVATFLILGDVCTRACRFCAVKTGTPGALDAQEPFNVARAIEQLSLRYIVITSVTRDDLPDGGAGHFAQTIKALKQTHPSLRVEALIPDFFGNLDLVHQVIDAGADVVSHNMETVRSLSKTLRPQADYQVSLKTLGAINQSGYPVLAKSGFMVGLGETLTEITELMQDLISGGCDILTIGQYLAPLKSARHVPVARFMPPEEFEMLKNLGQEIGFKHVFSGPLVRSSYLAEESYRKTYAAVAASEKSTHAGIC